MATQASMITQDNISLLDTISNDQDVVLIRTEQHQTVHITSSVEEIFQVKKEIDETLQPVSLAHTNVANEADEKAKHKKQKKDKKKKHKKEKHKHKHKSKDHSGLNVVESQIKSEYLEDVKEEAVVFNEVPVCVQQQLVAISHCKSHMIIVEGERGVYEPGFFNV
jgi:hypothetical protein